MIVLSDVWKERLLTVDGWFWNAKFEFLPFQKDLLYIQTCVCVWNCSVLNRSRIQAQLSPCKENIYKGNKYGLPSEAKHTKHIKTPKFATVPQDVWKRHTLYCSSAQDMYRVAIMRYHEISWHQTVSTLRYSLPFKRAIHGAFMGFVFWALTAGALVPFKDAHIVVTKLAASASSSLVLAEIGRGIGETDPTTEHGFMSSMRVLSYFQRSSDFSCSFRVPFTFSKCSFGWSFIGFHLVIPLFLKHQTSHRPKDPRNHQVSIRLIRNENIGPSLSRPHEVGTFLARLARGHQAIWFMSWKPQKPETCHLFGHDQLINSRHIVVNNGDHW